MDGEHAPADAEAALSRRLWPETAEVYELERHHLELLERAVGRSIRDRRRGILRRDWLAVDGRYGRPRAPEGWIARGAEPLHHSEETAWPRTRFQVHSGDRRRELYRGDEETVRALRRLIEAERQCCPYLQFGIERPAEKVRVNVSFHSRHE